MYGNGHDGENHADVRDERSIRRLAHARRKLPRGGPNQPSERDGAGETTADKDLDIHVVAVHARVRVREAGETAMKQAEIVGTDAKQRVLRKHRRGRPPQPQSARPLHRERQRPAGRRWPAGRR